MKGKGHYYKIETGSASIWLQYIDGLGILNASTGRHEPCTPEQIATTLETLRSAGFIVSELGRVI